ncbi:MAG: alpha-hydroxy-acid oxidizing protein [Chitinophagales bacterium]
MARDFYSKGIQSVADAVKAEVGVSGIVLSNHGASA